MRKVETNKNIRREKVHEPAKQKTKEESKR